jgi:hypothetical protein
METIDIERSVELVLGYRLPSWLPSLVQLAILARCLVITTPNGSAVFEHTLYVAFPNWDEEEDAYDPRHEALFMVLDDLDDMGVSCEIIVRSWRLLFCIACMVWSQSLASDVGFYEHLVWYWQLVSFVAFVESVSILVTHLRILHRRYCTREAEGRVTWAWMMATHVVLAGSSLVLVTFATYTLKAHCLLRPLEVAFARGLGSSLAQ